MKARSIWIITLVAMAGASARATIITNYYSGSVNNSTNYGVTADNFYNQGSEWKDTAIRRGDPTTTYGQGGINSVTEQTIPFPLYRRYNTLVSFGNLTGISSSSDILSAYFHFYLLDVIGNGTWTIYGLSAADKDWSESNGGAGYTNKYSFSSTANWNGGGNFEASFTNNTTYGTFSTSQSTDVGTNKSIDVTQAIKDYVNGDIGGIIFSRQTGNNGLNISFTWAMDENSNAAFRPGLSVGVIPEPAAISLIAFIGGLSLFVHRRFRSGKNR